MPSSVLTLLRERRKRRLSAQRSGQARLTRFTLGVGTLLSLLVAILLLSAVWVYADLTRDLPSLQTLPLLIEGDDAPLMQPTVFYDRTGDNVITTLAPQRAARAYIPIDSSASQSLPTYFTRTAVFALDPQFWQHPGYTLGQAPTLTQRMVRDLLLFNDPPGWRRDWRERLLSAQLTSLYGRERVLSWYLNTADYGNHAYGAEQAAQAYFGKSAAALNLAESALLVAALESPALNPADAPQSAAARQLELINAMSAAGVVTESEAAVARAAVVTFRTVRATPNPAPAFTALVMQQLETQFPRQRLERGGLRIITTLDLDLHEQAVCAGQALMGGRVACETAQALPPLPPGSLAQDTQTGVMVLDPQSGQVLAFSGELTGSAQSAFNGPRRAGSSVSPFIYLTGFTRGLSPASLVWDVPGGLSNLPANIANLNDQYRGPLRLRVAMGNDYLTPAAQVLAQMGAGNVARTMQTLGLSVDAQGDPFALVQDGVLLEPLALAQAYAALAAEGALNGHTFASQTPAAFAVLRVETSDNALWLNWSESQRQQVVSAQLAYLLNDALGDDAARAELLGRPSLLLLDRPSAAKIGRTLDERTVWSIGYTPQRLTLVWMESPAALEPRLAAGLWHAVMLRASQNLPPLGWQTPPGVSVMDVCDPSGLLPTRYCPTVVREVFLNGNEPVAPDNLYQPLQINTESGLLATVFTPPALVEERVYMMVPADARPYVQGSDVEPPTAYDSIAAAPPNPTVNMTSPAMLSHLYGVVPVLGTAAGENFAYYRVQYGQGLNPQRWYQIGGNANTPVLGGTLVEWDTTTLNGLYALRLQVVRVDNTVETATLQVSIDNLPPTVALPAPQPGDTLPLAENATLLFTPQVSDNLFVERVDFYLDGRLLSSVTEAPYTLEWNATPGNHTLRLVAVDRSGNTAEMEVPFTLTR